VSRPFASAAVLLLLPFALAACRGDGSAVGTLEVDLRVSPTPPTIGETRIVVTVADASGAPVEGVEVEVEGNMLHPGMAPVIERAEEEEDGRYVVPGFPFSMSGDWVLTSRVKRGDEVLHARDHPVRVVGAGAAPAPAADTASP
jgi:hypothetical protein